jgi:hypothetical protein
MSIGSGPDVAWYPALSPGTIDGQYALSFAGREAGLFHVHMTSVAAGGDPASATVEPGTSLGSGSIGILEPGLAETDEYRGLIWIDEGTSGAAVLKFQQMSCEE